MSPAEHTVEQAPPAGPGFVERAARTLTLLMTGKIRIGDQQGLCRLRNISENGMMIETRAAVAPGEPIHVELRNARSLQGRIIWAKDGKAGVEFDAPIDVKDTVAVEVVPSRIRRHHAPRSPRIPRRCHVEAMVDGQSYAGTLHDISQGGVRLSLPFRPQLGATFPISIPGLPPKLCLVRWAGAEIGLAFVEPLTFEVLADWLATKIEA